MRMLRILLPVVLAGPVWADVMISEIMYHPASEKPAEEYIELYNSGTAGVAVGGWAFTKGVNFLLPAGTTIAGGGRLVVAADPAAFAAKYPGVTGMVGGWTGKLSNSSDRLVLENSAGDVVDEVEYSDDGDWAVRAKDAVLDFGHRGWNWETAADGGGASLELIQPLFDNSSGQNWRASTTTNGTPGAPNSVTATDIAPTIREVSHFPLVPAPTDPVRVTARVADDHGAVSAVSLYWRLDGSAAFQAVPMVDDGAHGDGPAGDGVFASSIPAQAQGAIVEFYVSATDAGSLVRTWPAPALDENGVPGQTANCLYQVDSTVVSTPQPLFRMILRAVDRQELAQINSNTPPISGTDQTYSGAAMNATFVGRTGTGTELRYRVELKNRGNSSRLYLPASLRLNFLEQEPWEDVVSLNLNSQTTISQLLGSEIFRRAGADMAASRAVRLRVNGVDPTTPNPPSYGFYAANEVVDSKYADAHHPQDSDGNAYRGQQVNYGADPAADLHDESNNPDPNLANPAPYRIHYFKETNKSEDRWSDLINLTQKISKGHSPTLDSPTYDPGYVEGILSAVDVRQWMSYFAANTIGDDKETSLANGRGDDYLLYIGVNDPRANLIPYDMDAMFGLEGASPTDTLFPMCQNNILPGSPPTPVNSFIKHPDFAPIYYSELKRMVDGAFDPATFNETADEVLGPLVAASVINPMKTFNSQRVAWIRTQIPLALSVTSTPPLQNGIPRTTTASASLAGRANAITTRSVKVNGVAAAWTAWTASWTAPAVSLLPGVNQVLVQSFDAGGVETGRLLQSVWYDTGSGQIAPATIFTDTTWTSAGGPWLMNSSVTVADGATLTIEAGATVYAANQAILTVNSSGRLIAQGTDLKRIQIGPAPGSGALWGGLAIYGATGSPRSQLSYVSIAGNTDTAIRVSTADVAFDHLQFGNPSKTYLELDGSSFLVSECDFPAPTAPLEPVHGTAGIKPGCRGIIRHCYFGSSIGYNDVIDFTGGQRPGPILQVLANVFTGSGDDILDLDGTDAWIEGNIFMHCHKNGAPDSAAAVSGGNNGAATSELTITGNLFYDVDHAVTAKQGNYYTFTNNTVVRQTKTGGTDTESAVFNLQDAIPAPPTTYGLGLYAEGNILAECEQLVRNYSSSASTVTLNNNLMALPWAGPGTGNVDRDPLFVHSPVLAETAFTSWQDAQIMKQWLALRPGSPALGTGPNGRDKGGVIPLGVSLAASVSGTTNQTSAQVNVGTRPSAVPPWQSGYTAYRWQLDAGTVSAAVPIATPLSLSGLGNGSHTLKVSGLNDAGYWQDDPAFGQDGGVTTYTWTVDPGYIPPPAAPLVRINEVLAKNLATLSVGGTFPDLIEIQNAGTATADLSGWGLSDSPSAPFSYTFPAGTTLAPGAYRLIYASSAAAIPAPKTGFALSEDGETLALTRSAAAGGGVADTVSFGHQLGDYSIGRRSGDGAWDLCRPTFGTENIVVPQAAVTGLRINEWLADPGSSGGQNFIELYNPAALPVNLGGSYLTDSPLGWPDRHAVSPLTFVAGNGYALFYPDGDPDKGADHLSFHLAPLAGEIGLLTPDLDLIDRVVYGPQTAAVSQGRTPNGGNAIVSFTQPSPGGPNPLNQGNLSAIRINEVLVANETLTNPDSSLSGWIELYNPTTSAVDLSDISLSNNTASPRAWVAAGGTSIPSGGYLVIQCNGTQPVSSTNTGVA
ncbi:MAG: hypothetical protein JWO82_2686, partial [Akkermansiaceae bacterium]|nr:hypothetical protein [Akkermansiaceae bacterium]